MNLWGILCHRLMDIADRLQLFVIYFYKLLCLFKDFFSLCYNNTDGIPNHSCNIAFSDHNIPVLLNMSHFIIWHIFCCEYTKHTWKCLCF